ncbi:helix-turn-helix domain-containing protein [Actinomadura barringtoniae]|nr:helix-turn-helix transcriptional regulator [Actinomadura barringtoniae]
MLGGQLRRLREGRGISRDTAGHAIRGSGSKISRLELGRVSFKERDVADLLTLYGVSDAGERAGLLELARQAKAPGWWHQYGDVLPQGFDAYIGLEEAASAVRIHETRVVPGLLQTPEYARAVTELSHPTASASEVERRVSVLMRRQESLRGPQPPQLWVVVDEAALRRRVGDVDIMRAQLASLAEAVRSPRVGVQIVRPRRSAISAVTGPFSLLRFAEPSLPDIVYLELQTSALYLDKQADLSVYKRALDRLAVNADPPTATEATLAEIVDDLG